MKAAEIKKGKWYETRSGTGFVIEAPHRGSVRVQITLPIPRGIINLSTRDFLSEVPEPPKENEGRSGHSIPYAQE